jgi:hypothetical protein
MVVLITGASAGIGAALAEQLHAAGAKLVLTARRLDRLEALNARLGGQHLVLQADVSKTEDCQAITDQAWEHFGRLDTVVANAGYGLYEPVALTTPQATRAIFATNVFGTTDLIHAAAPYLLQQSPRDGWRGQIMIVSSAVGRRGVPFLGTYSGTKAAQLAIAESLRVELEPVRIAVTSVHPIMTKTDFGSTAEGHGTLVLPRTESRTMVQTVDHVARRMVEAIERPKPEVWPSWPARVLFGLGTLFPSLMDRGMGRYRDQVIELNPQLPANP